MHEILTNYFLATKILIANQRTTLLSVLSSLGSMLSTRGLSTSSLLTALEAAG
jgi:hypothetical protein